MSNNTSHLTIILREDDSENDKKASVSLCSGYPGHAMGSSNVLPWHRPDERDVILQCLNLIRHSHKLNDNEVINIAVKLNLCDPEGHPLDEREELIGKELYQAIIRNDTNIQSAFEKWAEDNSHSHSILTVNFQNHGWLLQSYPWELLHDGEDFLFCKSTRSIIRWIDFKKQKTQNISLLKGHETLHIGIIDPRSETNELPYDAEIFKQLSHEKLVFSRFNELKHHEKLTFDAILEVFDEKRFHIIHIDTHGKFGRQCNRCKKVSKLSEDICQCGNNISKITPEGYLEFEGENGVPAFVTGERLGRILSTKGVQLVVLNACKSGFIGGGFASDSVAGGLIKQGIPAVLAFQFNIANDAAQKFMKRFYLQLANAIPIVEAVARAKECLISSDYIDAWYRPSLYLRSTDIEGRIFEPQETPPHSLEQKTPRQQPSIAEDDEHILSYQEQIFTRKRGLTVLCVNNDNIKERFINEQVTLHKKKGDLVALIDFSAFTPNDFLNSRCFIKRIAQDITKQTGKYHEVIEKQHQLNNYFRTKFSNKSTVLLIFDNVAELSTVMHFDYRDIFIALLKNWHENENDYPNIQIVVVITANDCRVYRDMWNLEEERYLYV